MSAGTSQAQSLRPWLAEIGAFADSASAVAIGLFDRSGRALYLNAGMRRLLHADDDAENLAERFALPRFAALADDVAGGLVHRGLLSFEGPDFPARTVRGEVHRRAETLLVIAEYDVAELQRVTAELLEVNRAITGLQRELARRQAELIQLNERKNEFIGVAAHDLRSPLTVIQGYATLLSRRPEMPEGERAELLGIIADSVQDMLRMLDNLLNIAEIEAGKLKLRPREVDLYAFVERTARLNRPLADQKGVALALDLAPDLPPVVLDPDRIRQVLNNLLGNAIKFSRSGTTVTLQVRRADENTVEIAVIDQGQGIRPEELGLLFTPFQKTSTRATGGEHSSGLGLAICKRIVEISGGDIRAASDYGQGSRFSFTLPIAPKSG